MVRTSSAHWDDLIHKMDDKAIRQAFNITPPQTGLRQFLHQHFQKRYEAMGRGFPNFDKFNSASHVIAEKQGRLRDLDTLRQALSLAVVDKYRLGHMEGKTFAVIGDGLGVLSALVLMTIPKSRVVCVNLPRILPYDVRGVEQVMGETDRLIPLSAVDYAKLKDHDIDLAFNIASFQEMEREMIEAYFEALRHNGSWLYCCNRLEKRLVGGNIIKFERYPWQEDDFIVFDSLCPWHQDYYQLKPRRLRFHRRFEGPIQHRLVRLAR